MEQKKGEGTLDGTEVGWGTEDGRISRVGKKGGDPDWRRRGARKTLGGAKKEGVGFRVGRKKGYGDPRVGRGLEDPRERIP